MSFRVFVSGGIVRLPTEPTREHYDEVFSGIEDDDSPKAGGRRFKVTADIVRKCRELRSEGAVQRVIAAEVGVGESTVQKILGGMYDDLLEGTDTSRGAA